MTEYTEFEAKIEPMEWGTSTYTVLRLPADVLQALGAPKRVEGELNEHPVNLAVTRAPVLTDPFLWTGKDLLKRIGVAPGDLFEARLRAADPNHVETPSDVLRAIRSGGVSEAWDGLTPGKKRGCLHTIETAKRAETRSKRIKALISELS